MTLATKLSEVIHDSVRDPTDGILTHKEGVDLLPSNLELASMEMSLVTAMCRETALRSYLDTVRNNYDFIIIDCMPSLGMITLNALTAADGVIIPVQAQYLPAKGKMDLDTQVAKLRLLKSNYLSEKYKLEDKILKYYPKEIARLTEQKSGIEADIDTAGHNPKTVNDEFVGMTVKDKFYTERAAAGDAVIAACKDMTTSDPIRLGKYRGFDTELEYDVFEHSFKVLIKGKLTYHAWLGTDNVGNVTRIDNVIDSLPKRLSQVTEGLENAKRQLETAKEQVEKPFAQEEELASKTARLAVLNSLLNVDRRENEIVAGEPDYDEAKISDRCRSGGKER